MTDFPLCKEAGLVAIKGNYTDPRGFYVNATDVEALLSRAMRVFIHRNKAGEILNLTSVDGYKEDYYKESGLLVNVRPIVRDTAESLLREFTKQLSGIQERNDLRELVDRSKRLLQWCELARGAERSGT